MLYETFSPLPKQSNQQMSFQTVKLYIPRRMHFYSMMGRYQAHPPGHTLQAISYLYVTVAWKDCQLKSMNLTRETGYAVEEGLVRDRLVVEALAPSTCPPPSN